MNRLVPALKWTAWAVLGLTLVALTVLALRSPARLEAKPLPVLGQVGPFTLTNQHGSPVTDTALRGSIWVADIIFTRCPGPCVTLSRNLARVQETLRGAEPVRLISLTADPAYDTVEVLKHYAARYQADPARWQFLTGDKGEVYRLAIDGLKLGVTETPLDQRTNLNDLFIHSTTFVLVDRAMRLRATYDGTEPEVATHVRRDLRRLLREP
jgi:protein SCO1/2